MGKQNSTSLISAGHFNGIAARDHLRSRLTWRNNFNDDPAKLAAVRLQFAAFGLGFALQHAREKLIEND
jgi:hypothetical protein